MAKIPKGLFGRGTKIAMAASKLAMHEVSSRLKSWETEKEKIEAQIQMAQSLVKTLSELKGASLKVGQLMSLDLGDFLPPQVRVVLETLHQNVVAHSFEEMDQILRAELKDKYKDLKDISKKPLASASIGQVHTATLNNKKVVLKIQYPGVRESIPDDVKILRILMTQFNRLQGKDIDFTALLSEIESVLIMETDYRHELQMLKLYQENFSQTDYIIPEAYDEYCSEHVLCMEFIDGEKIGDWSQKANVQNKNQMAKNLVKLYLTEFFTYGLVQTDPNPGNFLVTANNELALLDFGAVRKYDLAFIQGYKRVLAASINNDDEAVLKESYAMNFIDPREDDEVKNIFLKLMSVSTEYFRQETPINLSERSFIDESQKLSWALIRKARFSPPPRDLVFLHRKLAGLFVLIKRLNVEIKLKDFWEEINQ